MKAHETTPISHFEPKELNMKPKLGIIDLLFAVLLAVILGLMWAGAIEALHDADHAIHPHDESGIAPKDTTP